MRNGVISPGHQNWGQGEEVSTDTWHSRQWLQNTTIQGQDSSYCTEVTSTCWTENRNKNIYMYIGLVYIYE